jgi:hypothetical protein
VSYDALLVLHLFAAFATVMGLGLFVAMFVTTGAGTGSPLLRLSRVAEVLWAIGSLGVLVFGIWLAIHVDGYEVWDIWVIAAILLWAVAGAASGPVTRGYRTLRAGSGEPAPLALHATMVLAVLLLLIDMIWKPGA